jgi:hypothetical protein
VTVDQAIIELEKLSEVYGDHELTIKFGVFTFAIRELEIRPTKFEVAMVSDVHLLQSK